jgi:Tfp pilus assembly protein PilX
VDAVNDDRGQALVLAVLVLGIAAATIVGLRAAQDRILSDARERRAGEAAVEAAGAALADAEITFRMSLRDATSGPLTLPSRAELDGFVGDPLTVQRVRDAANSLAAANGGEPVRDLTLRVASGSIEIALVLGSHSQRASIESRCCRP